MIHWLKYYPLKLRTPDRNREQIGGPRFQDAKPVWVEFEGTRIEIRAPRHRSEIDTPTPHRMTRASDQSIFRPPPNVATDHWEYLSQLARHWSYVYPWFGGGASELYLNIGAYKRRDGENFKKRINFLHPKGFENAVCNILDNGYGAKLNSSKTTPLYRGPIDWTPRKDLPIPAVEFWIKGNKARCSLMFPLTEKHIGIVTFGFMSHDKRMQEQADPLVRQMLDSVKITLSPETQTKWAKIQADNPGVSISETLSPLKWPVKPEDID
jgi:hypothetical protein